MAYILPLCFLTPNLWGHWTDLNQPWTHIHLWLLFEKFGSNFPGHLPPRAGGLKTILGTDFELCPNISLQQNIVSAIGKKLINLQGLPYMPPNLVNFGPETAENDWRVFAHRLKFALGDMPALPHGRHITDVAGKFWHLLCSGTCLQYRTTKCRAGSSWALPCI